MRYRPINRPDLSSVLALQEANFFANLPEEKHQDVFLSAAFAEHQFQHMAREVAVFVADDDREICTCLRASSVAFHRRRTADREKDRLQTHGHG